MNEKFSVFRQTARAAFLSNQLERRVEQTISRTKEISIRVHSTLSVSRKNEESNEKSIREVEEKKENRSPRMTPTTAKTTVLRESNKENSDKKSKELNEAATQTSFLMSADELERLKNKNKRQSLIQSDTVPKHKLKQMIQVQKHEKVIKKVTKIKQKFKFFKKY